MTTPPEPIPDEQETRKRAHELCDQIAGSGSTTVGVTVLIAVLAERFPSETLRAIEVQAERLGWKRPDRGEPRAAQQHV